MSDSNNLNLFYGEMVRNFLDELRGMRSDWRSIYLESWENYDSSLHHDKGYTLSNVNMLFMLQLAKETEKGLHDIMSPECANALREIRSSLEGQLKGLLERMEMRNIP